MSKAYKKPNKNNKALVMSIVIASLMVMSVFGVIFYGYSGTNSTYRYNKFRFTVTPQGFSTKINKTIYYFDYLPQDVIQINTSLGIKEALKKASGVGITYSEKNPYREETALAQYNIGNVLMSKNIPVLNGFTEENPYDLPVLTCNNATNGIVIIELIESDKTSAVLEEGCIKLMFDTDYNLKRISSKIIYLILDVIEE